jgi:tetratricopeptide (TPR) repeat protein
MGATDVRDQIATTLGGAYRLDRELGGGGMSRVFVAHEAALGRDVVVKVLAPALAEGLSAERFAREIRLAAQLQEPHIVPVLTAGTTADGLPYYTMPFVRGESLRARLEHGPVRSGEAIAILHDVLRALAYAHAHGVVHRDIKPENVLLSSGTAVVTDFGIAKALQASRTVAPAGPAGVTLTQIGMSLGTPAYMAPEQAAGDPATDHRADLYAWGVMAYELLAGRHPFAGKTSPQQLLAAHLVETPPPLDTVAGGMPAMLAALVTRCLAKDPAERPDSADAALATLDAARDEAVRERGGAAPSRGTLARAFVLYAVAFVVVALLARMAISALGLPDWVLPGALVVMALGLPVLLVTGFVHHQAHHRSATAPLAVRARPHMTWRRAVWGGVATLGVFVLLVAGYMTLRAMGIGPAGSLLAAGVIEVRERLLVADFQVAGADTALGPVVAEAVRTNLGQSRAISIVPVSQVVAALRRMRRPAASRLDAALAREVAEREGVRAVVGGDVTPLDGGYIVTLRLVASENGDVLASFQKTAAGPTELIPTLDRLSRDLRGKIGESLRAVRADPPLDQVTTPSLDALRKYTAATIATNIEGDYTKAAALSREAIALDSTFAMAHRSLANALYNARIVSHERDSAFVRAYRYRDRLTERERLLATTSYFQFGPVRDYGRAALAYDALIARDSNDHSALNNFGALLLDLREFARAEAVLRRTAEMQPRVTAYLNLAQAEMGQGKLATAESTSALILRKYPEAAAAPTSGIRAALAGLKYDSAAARTARWRAAAQTPAARGEAADFLAQIARTRGQLAHARRLASEARALRAAAGSSSSPLGDSLDAAREDVWIRAEPARAIARLDALLGSPRLDTMSAARRRVWQLLAIPLYAAAGQPARAHAMFDEVTAASDSVERRARSWERAVAEAEIALAEGRAADALAAFRRADLGADGAPVSTCTVCVLPGLARAAERAGWADSARIFWERYATTPSLSRLWWSDQWMLGTAYRRLGELYAIKGDLATATKYDREFLALWQNADPDLQPQAAAVRRHLAQLTQNPPGTPPR